MCYRPEAEIVSFNSERPGVVSKVSVAKLCDVVQESEE